MALDMQSVDLDELRRREDYRFIGCGADALESTVEQAKRGWISAQASDGGQGALAGGPPPRPTAAHGARPMGGSDGCKGFANVLR